MIFVGFALLMKALLEKHFARTRSMHQVQNKINRTLLEKKTLRDFIKSLWGIYHRENTGLIMAFF